MNTKLFRWLTGGACPRRYSSRRYSRSGCRIPLPLPCAASDLVKEPKRNMATDFRIDCKTCNIPAKKGRLRVRPGVPAPQETHPAQMKRRASALVGGGPGSLNNSRNSKVLKEFRLKDRSCGFPVP